VGIVGGRRVRATLVGGEPVLLASPPPHGFGRSEGELPRVDERETRGGGDGSEGQGITDEAW
jgi:hypothetical protein